MFVSTSGSKTGLTWQHFLYKYLVISHDDDHHKKYLFFQYIITPSKRGFSKRSSLLTDHWTFENKALTFLEQVLPQNNPDKCGGKTKKFWKHSITCKTQVKQKYCDRTASIRFCDSTELTSSNSPARDSNPDVATRGAAADSVRVERIFLVSRFLLYDFSSISLNYANVVNALEFN